MSVWQGSPHCLAAPCFITHHSRTLLACSPHMDCSGLSCLCTDITKTGGTRGGPTLKLGKMHPDGRFCYSLRLSAPELCAPQTLCQDCEVRTQTCLASDPLLCSKARCALLVYNDQYVVIQIQGRLTVSDPHILNQELLRKVKSMNCSVKGNITILLLRAMCH